MGNTLTLLSFFVHVIILVAIVAIAMDKDNLESLSHEVRFLETSKHSLSKQVEDLNVELRAEREKQAELVEKKCDNCQYGGIEYELTVSNGKKVMVPKYLCSLNTKMKGAAKMSSNEPCNKWKYRENILSAFAIMYGLGRL